MAEYIEREALLEDIQAAVENGGMGGMVAGALKRYVTRVPAADVAPAQKWISVKDRLPEAGGYVVCIAKRNQFSRFMPMVAKIEKNGWVNPITEQYISAVSHWMPIPEPPKEE